MDTLENEESKVKKENKIIMMIAFVDKLSV